MKQAVIVTGCCGGIGRELVRTYSDAGWRVIGIDCVDGSKSEADCFIKADVGSFSTDAKSLSRCANEVRSALGGAQLAALINNAALQVLGSTADVAVSDFVTSMNVNVIAPFALVKTFVKELGQSRGCVINIGSVHALATKPDFVAYATSKAALHGLGRALAVDLGPEIRVNTLAPAATATTMLKAGFENDPDALDALKSAHPLARIAEPSEIARMALFLSSRDAGFMTGATLYADGGVLSRLHDPL